MASDGLPRLYPRVVTAQQLTRPARYHRIERDRIDLAPVGSWRGRAAFEESVRSNLYSERDFPRRYRHIRGDLYRLVPLRRPWSRLASEGIRVGSDSGDEGSTSDKDEGPTSDKREWYKTGQWTPLMRAYLPRSLSVLAGVLAGLLILYGVSALVGSEWFGLPGSVSWPPGRVMAFLVVFGPPVLLAFAKVWWRTPGWRQGFRWAVGLLGGWAVTLSLIEFLGGGGSIADGIVAGLIPAVTSSQRVAASSGVPAIQQAILAWINVAGLVISGLIFLAVIRVLARDFWDRTVALWRRADTMVIGLTDTGYHLVQDLLHDLAVRDRLEPGRIVAVELTGDEARVASVRALGVPVVKVDPGDLPGVLALGKRLGKIPVLREWTARNVFLTSNTTINNLRIGEAISRYCTENGCSKNRVLDLAIYSADSSLVDGFRAEAIEAQLAEGARTPTDSPSGGSSAMLGAPRWTAGLRDAYVEKVLRARRRRLERVWDDAASLRRALMEGPGSAGATGSAHTPVPAPSGTPGPGLLGALAWRIVRRLPVRGDRRPPRRWYFSPAEAAAGALVSLVVPSPGSSLVADGPASRPGALRIVLLGSGPLQESFVRKLAGTLEVHKQVLGDHPKFDGATGRTAEVLWLPLLPERAPRDAGIPPDLQPLMQPGHSPCQIMVADPPVHEVQPSSLIAHLSPKALELVQGAELVVVDGTSSNQLTARLIASIVHPDCTVAVVGSSSPGIDTDSEEARALEGYGTSPRLVVIDESRGVLSPGHFVLSDVDLRLQITHELFRWHPSKDRKGWNPSHQDWDSPFLDPESRRKTVRFVDQLLDCLERPVDGASSGRRLLIGSTIAHVGEWQRVEPDNKLVAAEARREHEDWCMEQVMAGYRYGATMNSKARIHDDLLRWEDLDPSVQEKNVASVQANVDLLGKTGYMFVEIRGDSPGEQG